MNNKWRIIYGIVAVFNMAILCVCCGNNTTGHKDNEESMTYDMDFFLSSHEARNLSVDEFIAVNDYLDKYCNEVSPQYIHNGLGISLVADKVLFEDLIKKATMNGYSEKEKIKNLKTIDHCLHDCAMSYCVEMDDYRPLIYNPLFGGSNVDPNKSLEDNIQAVVEFRNRLISVPESFMEEYYKSDYATIDSMLVITGKITNGITDQDYCTIVNYMIHCHNESESEGIDYSLGSMMINDTAIFDKMIALAREQLCEQDRISLLRGINHALWAYSLDCYVDGVFAPIDDENFGQSVIELQKLRNQLSKQPKIIHAKGQ